jgi:hypothetical protein
MINENIEDRERNVSGHSLTQSADMTGANWRKSLNQADDSGGARTKSGAHLGYEGLLEGFLKVWSEESAQPIWRRLYFSATLTRDLHKKRAYTIFDVSP